MENVIDAEYREVVDLSTLSTETLTEQANTIYAQAETVATISLQLVAEAGRRLIVIKERVGHGEWEDWMKKNLSFSGRKANRMMKLAEKMENEGSLFSNPTTLSDIGISKVWALLEAPEEVAAEVVSGQDAESMTVRELKEEIKRIKSENEALGADQAALSELRDKVFRQTSRIKELEDQIENTESTEGLEQQLEAAKRNLQNVKEKLAHEKEKARAAAEEVKRKAMLEADQKIKDAAEAEKAKISSMMDDVRKEEAVRRADLEAENEKLKKMADPVMVEFKIRADALQEDFAACRKAIAQAEPERQEKMKAALKVVLQKMEERL